MMSRQRRRNWQQFPTAYYAALDASMSDKPVELECDSTKAAYVLRNDLYNFFGALRLQRDVFKQAQDRTSYEAINCMNWCDAANSLMLVIRGTTVVVKRRPFADPPPTRKFDPELHDRMKQLVERRRHDN